MERSEDRFCKKGQKMLLTSNDPFPIKKTKKSLFHLCTGMRHVGISSLVAATVGATAYPGVGLPDIARTTTQQR